jgi:hypothetical protein
VRQHEAHPHTPPSVDLPDPELQVNHGYSAREEELAPRDSMADAMAQRMLQGALGGVPEDDDDDDRELGMHIERVAAYGLEGDIDTDDDLELRAGDLEARMDSDADGSDLDGSETDEREPAADSLPPLELQQRKTRPTTHH